MAGKPYTLNAFKGLDNINAPETLASSDKGIIESYLTEAKNVDISRTGRVTRRQGFTLHTSGSCHSLWFGNGSGFVVKNNRLGSLDTNLAFTDLHAASERYFSYADTGAGIYMTDGVTMLRYRDSTLTELANVGTYDPASSYLDPSEDTVVYDSPMPGNLVVWMFGRLWVATDEAIFYSRGYYPDQFNLSVDFIDEPNVTLLGAASDGVYIGTDKRVQFFASDNPKNPARVTTVSSFGAVARTQLLVEDAAVFGIKGASGPCVVWESAEGKMLGLGGGNIVKMTDPHAAYVVGNLGASLLRNHNGETQHISTLVSRDGDSSNMRTTDTAVAEVVRNGILVQ
jgi:hypothetical protein